MTEYKFIKVSAGYYKLIHFDNDGIPDNVCSNIWKRGSKWYWDFGGYEHEPEKRYGDIKKHLQWIYDFVF